MSDDQAILARIAIFMADIYAGCSQFITIKVVKQIPAAVIQVVKKLSFSPSTSEKYLTTIPNSMG